MKAGSVFQIGIRGDGRSIYGSGRFPGLDIRMSSKPVIIAIGRDRLELYPTEKPARGQPFGEGPFLSLVCIVVLTTPEFCISPRETVSGTRRTGGPAARY